MTDHEKRIREALEAGPTEGPFQVVRGGTYCWDIKTTDSYDVATTHGYVRNQVDSLPTAEFIAACNPAAIRALLADLDAARAALSEAKAGGWVAVPVEPTQAMLDAADKVQDGCNFGLDDIYKAMLAARPLPAPPAQKEPT